MSVLITGGAGAIGQNLAQELSKTRDVVLLDNLSGASVLPPGNARFFYCDLRDRAKLNDIFNKEKPQEVYHLAAHFANQNSVDFPIEDSQANIIGTINVLEALRSASWSVKLLYASTSCIYGNAQPMSESNNALTFDTPYAISKYSGELYCKTYSALYGIPSVVVRIFNTYGPYELGGKYRNVIANFIGRALSGDVIPITGTGEETRDFTYVEDTVCLLIKAMSSANPCCEIYNGGTGVGTRIIDLANLIVNLSGSRSQIEYTHKRVWDEIHTRVADISKSRTELQYEPRVSIDDGIQRTIDWTQKYLADTSSTRTDGQD